jgi:transcriptional regulator of acetoin/glycerol metabolism
LTWRQAACIQMLPVLARAPGQGEPMRGPTARYHADRVQQAIASGGSARSAVVASWHRSSALHHLDPADRAPPRRLSEREFREARERVEPLLRAAEEGLDRLRRAVGGLGCCVMLADRDGVPLERRGSPADDPDFRGWGLWTGAVWSEAAEGTNGIGTCLAEGRPVSIHRDQHFFTRNTALSCTSAPIHDHEARLAAVLDVSSCRADLTEALLGLIAHAVQDAARRIEGEAFRLAFPDARVLVAPGTEKSGGGLIAVDRDDLVVGATRAARQALGLTAETLARPRPVSDLLGVPDGDLDSAERGVLQRALARADGNASAAAQALGISRATLYRKLNRLGLA